MRLLGLGGCLAVCLAVVGVGCGDDTGSGASGAGSSGGAGGAGAGMSGGGDADGGGGASSSCGNGELDSGEECDDAAETAGCDADCTAVSCGDGQHNVAAGEGCDDGNSADADACSPSCVPSVLSLSPVSESGSDAIAVAFTGGPFSLGWTTEQGNATTFRFANLSATGLADQTDVGTAQGAGWITVGANADGSGFLLDLAVVGAQASLAWRFISPGGVLETAGAGSEVQGADYFAPAGNPIGKLFGTPSGAICGLSASGTVRCTEGTNTFAPAKIATDDAVRSAHMFAVGDAMVASYVAAGPSSDQFRVQELAGDGTPTGAEQTLTGAPANAYATGGVAHPDGSFGVALSVPGNVTWYPFHADGQLDATNVRSFGTPQGGRHKLVATPDGRFLLVWYESDGPSTCPLVGRVFDANVDPVGDPFVIYQAPNDACAARYDLAVNPAGDVVVAWQEYHQGGSFFAKAILLPRLLEP